MFASFVLGRTLAHRRAANHDFASYFLNRRPPAHVSGEFLGLCSFREREREREREGGGREGETSGYEVRISEYVRLVQQTPIISAAD